MDYGSARESQSDHTRSRLTLGDPGCGAVGRSLIPSRAWFQVAEMLRLSSRELQIVQHVFDDRTLDDIAVELGISSHTVTTYFERLYSKLHVSSRSQLILLLIAEYMKLSLRRRDVEMPGVQATREDPT